MDRGAWQATVHGVAKSRTQLSDFTFTFTLTINPHLDTDEGSSHTCFDKNSPAEGTLPLGCFLRFFLKSELQEYWGGVPFPTLGDLPNPGIKPAALVSPALAGRFFTTSAAWEAPKLLTNHKSKP